MSESKAFAAVNARRRTALSSVSRAMGRWTDSGVFISAFCTIAANSVAATMIAKRPNSSGAATRTRYTFSAKLNAETIA